jgi:hypothetical protein
MAKHPNNGPTFSKPTIKQKPFAPPSPDRQKAKVDEDARDAAWLQRFRTLRRTDLAAWLAEFFGKKE